VSDAVPSSPEERLERWAARDTAIGLAAECDQLRAQLADRETEIADLRERLQHLRQRVGQLEAERPRALRVPVEGRRASLARRVYRRLRALARRVLAR
jgi:chromosome segregation ATPase